MTTAAKPETSNSTAVTAPIRPRDQVMSAPELKKLTTAEALAVIKPRLPAGVSVESVYSEVITAIQRDPKLAECTPASLIDSVAKIARWGLTIGEKAHLVPFSSNVNVGTRQNPKWDSEMRCQAIRDYKGDIELVIRAGGARLIDANVWYEKEPFAYSLGTSPKIEHQPLSPMARGKLVGAYAVAKVGAYDYKIVVMFAEEIDAIRLHYSKSWKTKKVDKKDVPIELADIPWYAKKTVVHQIVKQLPSTPALDRIVQQLDKEEREILDEEIVTDYSVEGGAEPGAGGAAPATNGASASDVSGGGTTPVRDYAWASTVVFPFHRGTPNYQRPLVEIASDLLVTAAEHITATQEKRGAPEWNGEILAAIQLILAAREAGTAPIPAAPKPAAPDPVKAAAETQKAAAKPAAAPPAPKGFAALSREISKLLDSADRTDDEKKDILEKMESAASVADLQRILDDLELPV